MAAITFNIDADFTRVAMLSHTKFVVVYRANVSLEPFAAVGTVSGGTISFSGFVSMDPGPVSGFLEDSFAVAPLDSEHALAAWSGSGTGAWAAVLTIAGTDITVGPRNQFSTDNADWMDVVPLAGGKALIAFRKNIGPGAYNGVALVATVAGSDVTFGATYAFDGGSAAWVSATLLPSGHAVIAYVDASLVGRALIATVVETSVAFGSASLFQIGESEANVSVLALGNGDRFVITYKNGKGYAKVGTRSGTSIAFGPPKEFYSGSDLYATRTKLLGPDQAVFLSRHGNFSANTSVDRLMTFSGDTITLGPPTTSVLDTADYIDLGAEENGTVVVVYARHTPDNDGLALQLEQYESVVTQPPSRGKFSDDAAYCAVARLSSTKFIVAFCEGPSLRASAAVGTLSGTDVTFGPSAVVDAQTSGGFPFSSVVAVAGLDSTHALAVWGGASPARAAVLTVVGGTSVTVGPPADFAPDHSADFMNAVRLGAGRVLIVFRDLAGPNVKAVVATVSGTDVSFGALAALSPADSPYGLRAAQLSSTKAVLAFTDPSSVSKALIAAVGAGGAVTFGAPNAFQTGEPPTTVVASLMKLDELGENFAVAYVHGKGYIRIGTVSGTGMGVTFGQETEFYALAGGLRDMCVARLDASHGALAMREGPADGPASGSRDRLVTFGAPIALASPGVWYADGGVPQYLASAALDGENVVVVYRDSLSGDGLAVLRQYAYAPPTTTTTEPPGTPTIVGSNLTLCRAAKLSSSAFVVVWRDPGDGNKAKAAVGRFDGTDVTFGAPKAMDSQWSGTGLDTFAVVRLDSTRALAVWRRYKPVNDQIMACVLTKRGTFRIDVGSPVVMFTGVGVNSLQYLEPVFLSTGKVLVAFQNQVSANRPSAVVATVSGNSVSFGAFHELVGPDASLGVRAAAISATKAVVAFSDTNSGNDGKAVVATVSGTDVTFGAPATFQTGAQNVTNISVLKLDGILAGNRFAVVYKGEDTPSENKCAVKVGTLSGTSIAFGAANIFSTPSSDPQGTRLSLLVGGQASPPVPARVSFVYLDGLDARDVLVEVDGDDADFGVSRTWFTGGPGPLVKLVIERVDTVAMDAQNAIAFYVDYATQDIMAALLTYPAGPFVTTTTSHPPVTVGSPDPPPGGVAPPNLPPPTTTTTVPPPPTTKWEQPPDETPDGVDVRACDTPGGGPTVVLADDWVCSQRGELAAAWLWCSYLNDDLPPGGPAAPFLGLRLSIHSDIPSGPYAHSCPGDLLWEHYFVPGVDCAMVPHAALPPQQGEWFWDPSSQDPPTPEGDHMIFRIDCDLTAPGVPQFVQEGDMQQPRTYWLDVQAFLPPDNPAMRFGWKTSPAHLGPDNAVFAAASAPAPADWHAMTYPPPHPMAPAAPVDLAFGLSFRPQAAPATTTTTTTTSTVPPPTTTSTVPPPTTTTTTTSPQVPHPADSNANFRCEPFEVLSWANAWLNGAVLNFLGTPLTGPGVAQTYILRAAAIALANFQTRYQDGGTVAPVNSTAHPQRWLATPDI